jgi:predicted helicase
MRKAKIYYARMDEFWRKEEKLRHLEELEHIGNVVWQEITPDQKHTWLTEGLESEFDKFIVLHDDESESEEIFSLSSNGVKTNRDVWAYNFNKKDLSENIKKIIKTFNEQAFKWRDSKKSKKELDSFLLEDEQQISWSEGLKNHVWRETKLDYDETHVRRSLYRPFTSKFLYFDEFLNERRYLQPLIFPHSESEPENSVICVGGYGRKEFAVLCSQHIPDLNFYSDPQQSFSFYIYDKDGSNRRENITDWSLEQFQTHYQDPTITKWDIFHYTYAVLHHPHYRTRYAANLKRELPRIPFAPTFRPFATAGKRLAEIHIHYEQQPEYPLKQQENKDLPIDWRVEKMRLSKDKTQLKYNDFLTLTGIPPEVFEYRLGNRSALHWVIDQYQVSTDKRSGITNDPNRLDDEEYIVRLIKQVITVSLETVQIVNDFPDLGLPND